MLDSTTWGSAGWTPLDVECMRCHQPAPLRFYGLCSRCTDELHVKFAPVQREIEVEAYVPKMNVTPNAVATKD